MKNLVDACNLFTAPEVVNERRVLNALYGMRMSKKRGVGIWE